METDPKEEIIEFLLEVKRTIEKGEDAWIFSMRQKNIDCLAELNYTMADVKSEILSLSVTDYCKGPIPDLEIKGDVWIFGKTISNKEIYIKLKLWGDKHSKSLRTLSFHPAENPLVYLFKEK